MLGDQKLPGLSVFLETIWFSSFLYKRCHESPEKLDSLDKTNSWLVPELTPGPDGLPCASGRGTVVSWEEPRLLKADPSAGFKPCLCYSLLCEPGNFTELLAAL